MTESVEETEVNQTEKNDSSVLDKQHMDTFGRIRWSVIHCLIALGMLVVFRVVFYVLRLWNHETTLYTVGMVLYILMFACEILIPLWIAHNQNALRRPRFRRIIKEVALAIPLAFVLIAIERLTVVVLSRISEGAVETSPTLSQLRGSPGDVRLYLLLITMFTLGPVAEELFYRGLVYNSLKRWIGPLFAAVLQAFIFMLVHYKWPETGIVPMGAVFLAGVLLAGLYELRKTLWSPIAVHVLVNFTFVVPVIVLIILNSHTPAQTWQEAQQPPDWLVTELSDIEKKTSGEQQRLHAINTWGSRGMRLWKDEFRGLQAVCEWFPDERESCAQARLGMIHIYLYYLKDFRRAVVQCDRILSEFEDQPETCAQALLMKARSFNALGDRETSKQCLREVIESYPPVEWIRQAVEEELKLVENK